MRASALIAALTSVALSACATDPSSNLTTSAVPSGPAAVAGPERGTPVVPGRPARVYVVVGFKEADCSPIAPKLAVAAPPAQGQVSFEPNQSTTVMQSSTGRCTGGRMPGTGVYYTARPGAQGTDTFTITATAESGVATSRTFTVRIAE